MQIAGVILFAICLLQVTLGLFIHRRQPKRGRIHPLRNYAHVVIGLAIIGLSFFVVSASTNINLNQYRLTYVCTYRRKLDWTEM